MHAVAVGAFRLFLMTFVLGNRVGIHHRSLAVGQHRTIGGALSQSLFALVASEAGLFAHRVVETIDLAWLRLLRLLVNRGLSLNF